VRLGGKVGGRYRLTKGPLSGGTAEVWLAHDELLGRRVALKRVVHAHGGPVSYEHARGEARAQAKLNHPNVATVHDVLEVWEPRSGAPARPPLRGWAVAVFGWLVGRRDEAPVQRQAGEGATSTVWLVMEYAPGGDLTGWPAMSPRLAAHFGAQLADALLALHGEKIVHCDIKPGNVLVTDGRTVKVADFGAAYRTGGKETITPQGKQSYTPDYAAPELANGREPVFASDVFSLATTVYALVAGEAPRRGERDGGDEGDGDSEIDEFIASRQAAHGPVELDADVGPLRELLTAMLRLDPAGRPTVAEAGKALREIAGPVAELPELPLPQDDEGRGAEPGAYNTATAPGGPGGPGGPADPSGPGGPGRKPAGRKLVDALQELGPQKRRRLVAAAATMALLAVSGAVVYVVFRDSDPNTVTPEALSSGSSSAPAPGPSPTLASTSSPTSVPPSASPSVIGDPHSADPCALVKPAAFGAFGDGAYLATAYGSFDRCDVILPGTAPEDIDIEVEFVDQSDAPPAGSGTVSGRVRVVEEVPESDQCERMLLLSTDTGTVIYVTVGTMYGADASSSLLCAIADTGTDVAVAALNAVPDGGVLARRTTQFPANSLFTKDACTLLTGSALEVVPGIDADHPEFYFGGWECDWQSSTREINVRVAFDRGQEPTAADGTPTQLGGLRAFIEPPDEEMDDSSTVRMVSSTFADTNGDTEAEMLVVTVYGSGSGPTQQQRSMATQLATAAATALSAA